MKIEVGKRYWRRDGSVSGVVSLNESMQYTIQAGHESYYLNGSFNGSRNHPLDLVAEYTGPELVPPGEKAKRTIVLKEAMERFGEYWTLNWSGGPYCNEKLVPPDEVVYTGNEKVVDV